MVERIFNDVINCFNHPDAVTEQCNLTIARQARFYRSRFSKDTQGIGLGLPLSKSIIEAHNGTIEVDSIEGRGTAFVITI